MTPEAIGERAARVVAVRAEASPDSSRIAAAFVDVRSIKAWADAQEAALIAQLRSVESFPEATIADANRCSVGAATKTKERAETLTSTPTLADALEEGSITAGHLDSVTRRTKKLDDEKQRQEFLDRADSLAAIAEAGTIEQIGRRLDLEVKKLQSDDGEDRLTRQKKAVRLSSWTDDEGMWNLRGRFDPETAIRLAARLDAAKETLFAAETPPHAPSDPIEKDRFLAGHAFIRLLGGGAGDSATTAGVGDGSSGASPVPAGRRPEFVGVIDADAPERSGPAGECSIPIELPPRVLAELAGTADVIGVVVRNGVVLHAPGELNLGRTTRLANRAQRRALRALYRCCAVPGCSVPYDRCKLHHVIWLRHGGRTDLDNLLPVCAHHHSKIHHDGWVVELGPRRELTLRTPDGRVRTTGPPNRRSAA